MTLDNKLTLPLGNKTISDNNANIRWGIGYSDADKDGLYIFRNYDPINLAKNYVVSAGYKKQKANTSIDMLEIDISSKENIESVLIHDQAIKDVKSFINSMPESLKTAYTLREVEGKSYDEISIITETPIGTVRSRIFRAREAIVEYIKEDFLNNE